MIDDTTPTPFYTYGERLAAIRDDHHLSLEAMAEAVGVSASTWEKFETEDDYPTQEVLQRLYTVFHVNERWLKDNEGWMYEDEYRPGIDPLGQK